MSSDYLKVPVEMAQFALSDSQTRQVQTYLTSQFLYSGKARTSDRPVCEIASICNISERTVYRSFQWLLKRNWFGMDDKNGWYFFRGIDRLHKMEDWQFARAGIIYPKDLKTFKPYCAGLVIASLVKTKKQEQRSESQRGNSEHTAVPISVTAFAKTLSVSIRTAQRLLKIANDCNYIDSRKNLIEVVNLESSDLKQARTNDIPSILIKLQTGIIRYVATDRIRYNNDKLFVQEPNNIEPLIHLKNR